MSKTVAEVMTSDPRTISREATVVDAAKLMPDEDVGSVPVTDGSRDCMPRYGAFMEPSGRNQ
jgi:CBS domain-containing protein